MRRVWFTSDLHLSHQNVISLSQRPFATLAQMEQTITENINRVVKPEDVLYLLGDVSLGKKDSWNTFLDALHCKNIILIRGNHDKWQAIPKDKVLAVFDQCRVELMGRTFVLSHYPYRIKFWRAVWLWFKWLPRPRRVFQLLSKKRPRDSGLWLLHGHTHAESRLCPYHPRMFHVGVDGNEFKPVALEEIIATIQRVESSEGLGN